MASACACCHRSCPSHPRTYAASQSMGPASSPRNGNGSCSGSRFSFGQSHRRGTTFRKHVTFLQERPFPGRPCRQNGNPCRRQTLPRHIRPDHIHIHAQSPNNYLPFQNRSHPPASPAHTDIHLHPSDYDCTNHYPPVQSQVPLPQESPSKVLVPLALGSLSQRALPSLPLPQHPLDPGPWPLQPPAGTPTVGSSHKREFTLGTLLSSVGAAMASVACFLLRNIPVPRGIPPLHSRRSSGGCWPIGHLWRRAARLASSLALLLLVTTAWWLPVTRPVPSPHLPRTQAAISSLVLPGAADALTAEVPLARRSGGQSGAEAAKGPKVSAFGRSMYELDNYLAEDPARMVVVMGAFCTVLAVVGGMLYELATRASGDEKPFMECLWTAWMFIANTGIHCDEETLPTRAAGMVVTFGGLIVFSVLVAAMADLLAQNVQALNRGANPVVESNHVIVSGWGPRTLPLVKELLAADSKRAVVVMGHEEKEAMEEGLRDGLKGELLKGAKVAARTGDPLVLEDWERCALQGAQSVVLVSPQNLGSQAADAQLIQASVALSSLPEVQANLVTELRSPTNVPLLQSMLTQLPTQTVVEAEAEGPKRTVVAVSTEDLGLRLLLDRALRPETVAVAKELLHCEGHEFQVKAWPELQGRTFGEVLFLFEDAVPCGILRRRRSSPASGEKCDGSAPWQQQKDKQRQRAPHTARSPRTPHKAPPPTPAFGAPSKGPKVLICPDLDTALEEDDQLLVIAEAQDSYRPGPSHLPQAKAGADEGKKKSPSSAQAKNGSARRKRKVLICGWRDGLLNAFSMLDSYLEKGSTVTIIAKEFSKNSRGQVKRAMKGLSHFRLELRKGDTQDYSFLESCPLEEYDTVLVLTGLRPKDGQGAAEGASSGDAQGDDEESGRAGPSCISPVSTCAMFVRSIQKQRGKEDAVLVAELPAEQEDVLEGLQSTWVSQAVDAEEIEALVLAQIAENPAVGTVLEEIVSGKGPTFALEDASQLATAGEDVTFWELQHRSARRGKIIVACKCKDMGDSWVLNPLHKGKVITVSPTDQLIVLG